MIQLLQLPLEHGPAAEACSHVLLLLVVVEQLRCGEGEKTHGGAEERPVGADGGATRRRWGGRDVSVHECEGVSVCEGEVRFWRGE